ncbi:hypothetical protein PENSPDRAFT_748798, partial [Peniophora sp. CONT]
MDQTPSYSAEPGPDERRLGIAVQSASTPAGSFGTLLQRGNGIVIALKNQQEDARIATYGRNASVAGEVSLSSTQGVTSVSIHLEGKAIIHFGATLIPELQLLDISSTLWEGGASGACPTVLPFGLVIPENFVDSESGSSYPLPPSYDPLGDSISLQDLVVRCVYRLTVHMVRSRWMPDKTMSVDIEYAPRTIPPQAIMDAPFPFFDTIKSSPEEWWQTSATVSVKPNAAPKPIDCDLFTPSVRIFTKRDMIPFFLQLRGTSSSILALYSPENQDEGLVRRLMSVARNSSTAPKLAISVQRQVVVLANGGQIAKSYIVGTGSLRTVPPGYTPPGTSTDVLTIDYEGEIQLAPHVTVGGFDIGKVRVSDFIELSIRPAGAAVNEFAPLMISVPVRIVTG